MLHQGYLSMPPSTNRVGGDSPQGNAGIVSLLNQHAEVPADLLRHVAQQGVPHFAETALHMWDTHGKFRCNLALWTSPSVDLIPTLRP